MKSLVSRLLLIASLLTSLVLAAPLDERAAFGTSPGRDVDAALKRAQKEKKRIFLATYDPKEGGNFPGLDIKYFTDLEETKKLLKENFIIVLLTKGHKDLERYKPSGNTEKAYYVVISSSGQMLKTDKMAANPETGLKIVKELIALQ